MKQPIRVLHVLGSLDAGGVESRLMDLYRKINKNLIQFDFIVHKNNEGFFEKEIIALGGKIYRFPERKLLNIISYYRFSFNFFLNHPEYTIIHGHSLSTGMLYLRAAKNANIKTRIAHSRCGKSNDRNISNIIKELMKRKSRKYATHLFSVSKIAAYEGFGLTPYNKGKVKIIPNAIDTLNYKFDPIARDILRKEYGIEPDTLIVGHVGRFTKQKNHTFLIDVFKEIFFRNKNSKLILVGDGKLKKKIYDYSISLGLENNIIFLGVRSDIGKILSSFDVLLFPSHFEGLPGTIIEAQANGLNCFISDKISDEVCITNLVQTLSLNESKETWAKNIISKRYTEHNRILYNEIVSNTEFDVNISVKWYENFYLSQ